MEHPYDKEIKVCSNEVSGVTNGNIVLYRFILQKLKNLLHHYSECIDIKHGALLGQEDLNLFK